METWQVFFLYPHNAVPLPKAYISSGMEAASLEHVLAKLGKMVWSLIIKAVCDAIKMEHLLTARVQPSYLLFWEKKKKKRGLP